MRVNRLATMFAAVLCLSMGLANAQEKVTLKLNLKPNEAWSQTQNMDMDMNITVNAGGQVQNMTQKMNMVISSVNTPLEVKDGSPTKMKTAFGDDCKMTVSMMGQTQNVPFPLTGKTITITRKDDGSVDVEPKGAVDAKSESMLKDMLDSSKHFYPDKPVAVGDKWNIKPETVVKMFQLEPGGKGDVECVLKSIKQLEGRKAAEVEMKGTAAGKMQGTLDVTIDMTGPMVIDVDSGQPLNSEITAKMTIKGAQGAGADQPQFNGDGKVVVKQTCKPAK